MIHVKYYRLVYDKDKEMYKPQIRFKWRCIAWLPFTSWYYLHIDKDRGYAWYEAAERNYIKNLLHDRDINIAENNLIIAMNHFQGLEEEERALKQSLKEFNKNKKHKVKML